MDTGWKYRLCGIIIPESITSDRMSELSFGSLWQEIGQCPSHHSNTLLFKGVEMFHNTLDDIIRGKIEPKKSMKSCFSLDSVSVQHQFSPLLLAVGLFLLLCPYELAYMLLYPDI